MTPRQVWSVGAAVLALAVSGCTSTTDGKPSTTTKTNATAARASYLACMDTAGWSADEVTELEGKVFADGGSDSGTPADPKVNEFRADLMRCQQKAGMLPDEKPEQGSDPSAMNKSIGTFVTCMRDRGWEMADPQPGPDGSLVPPPPQENLGAKQQQYNTDQVDCLGDSGLVQGGPPAGNG